MILVGLLMTIGAAVLAADFSGTFRSPDLTLAPPQSFTLSLKNGSSEYEGLAQRATRNRPFLLDVHSMIVVRRRHIQSAHELVCEDCAVARRRPTRGTA